MSIQQTTSDHTSTGQDRDQFVAGISTVAELLQQNLRIPAYQRPYTWSVKNVRQLVSDIQHFRTSGHYRLGTFILNEPELTNSDDPSVRRGPRVLNIVDGQQRYLTFGLMILALSTRSVELEQALSKSLMDRMEGITIPRRQDGQSEDNLRINYDYLFRVVQAWSAEELNAFTEFFLKECSVVVLVVKDLDSAFQLFDSQNTRGKALYPTDLLKAHHLREFSQTSTSREAVLETVRKWDALEPEEIEHLFAAVLFPIKRWTANEPVPEAGFTVEHIDLFKGIRRGNLQYRWAHTALMAKAMVDEYRATNATLLQYGVIKDFEFPFQILQPVIDGEMFFRMVDHYIAKARKAGIRRPPISKSSPADTETAKELEAILTTLEGLPRGTGNRYIRELFDCLLLAYVDRFGWHDVQQAADKLAQYSYVLRAKLQRVTMKSINNHAQFGHHRVKVTRENLFAKIARAESPDDILAMQDMSVKAEDVAGPKAPFQKIFPVVEEPTP